MSLLLMVLALLGALVVLGGGGLVLDRLLREVEGRRGPPRAAAVETGASGPAGPGEGGYSVLEGAERDGARDSPSVPAPTLARVRELLALGRGVEAVRVMRDETGMDQSAARDAVEDVRRGRLG
ncbi:hypothetical protein O4J56_08870 [Nocardiopsis sp. RSe5-2]|uniref:Ribosomal protein L7/L12 C-terminal domain-containing protein n=1 Tax=Nocardiopsis endophytica TaxID=3018445 RepID=A0ABT4U1B6_9ACTN|nr:hypothetical protein [Nocardiopsis endophytica]MDA2810744.1 hypothetical protein [Nocardiopsis endophytica]